MRQVIENLHLGGKLGTAHVYRSSLNAIIAYGGEEDFDFSKVNPEWVKGFETSLHNRGCSLNTISTYIRTFRAVYNRAVDANGAPYTPRLFKGVYTGTRADRKRALSDEDMKKVFTPHVADDELPASMQQARQLFLLMFLLRGIPFVDLAYLLKSDLRGNVLTYRRHKTGRPLTVTLTPEAMRLLKQCMNQDASIPYLLPLLRSVADNKQAYHEYQLALRRFNHQLRLWGVLLGLDDRLSSYTVRHTWATTAYYCAIPPGIISEAMGHSSITVTETYLKPFKNKKIDEANLQVIQYVMGQTGCLIN